MCGDCAGEDGDVVAPLEHAHDPAPRVSFRDRDDLSREDLEILDLQSQVADGVFGMGVEARTDQDELRPNGGRRASPDLIETPRGTPSRASRTATGYSRYGPALARAGFVARAGSGIERVSVNR